MPILRYTASADTTITNAYKPNLVNKGTGSNMGAADSLQIFSIYGRASSSAGIFTSIEKSRVLINFPIGDIRADRNSGVIPASGNVSFHLRMYNARTPFTLPKEYTLVVNPVSRSWQEGSGMDMDSYIDTGYANWIAASSASVGGAITNWTTEGGDYHNSGYVSGNILPPEYTQYFEKGNEDLNIDISTTVEEWMASNKGATTNYGMGIMLTASQEDGGEKKSYYIKKFFSRTSEFFFKRPVIEARWDDSKKDDRGDFYLSSALAPAADNLNRLYLYNFIRGKLRDIPSVGTGGSLFVSLYSGTTGPSSHRTGGGKLNLPAGGGVSSAGSVNITASWVSTGIYSASFATTSSVSSSSTEYLYDVWHSPGVVEYFTGSGISAKTIQASNIQPANDWVTTITNLRPSYKRVEHPRFRVFTRQQNWNPTIYSKATTAIEPQILRDAYYKVYRIYDNTTVVEYGTGSIKYTQLSYDASGSYFDLKMNLLEAGYAYGIKIMSLNDGVTYEHPEIFKFRVD